MKTAFILVISLLFSSMSFAESFKVKINRMAIVGNIVYLKVTPTPTDKISCATNTSYDYTFPLGTDGANGWLSMAMAAYMADTPVTVRSLNSCNNIADTQDVNFLVLEIR